MWDSVAQEQLLHYGWLIIDFAVVAVLTINYF